MSLPSALLSGSATATGSPANLAASGTLSAGLVVTTDLGNDGPVLVGASGGLAYALTPGASISMAIASLAYVYIQLGVGTSIGLVYYLGS